MDLFNETTPLLPMTLFFGQLNELYSAETSFIFSNKISKILIILRNLGIIVLDMKLCKILFSESLERLDSPHMKICIS